MNSAILTTSTINRADIINLLDDFSVELTVNTILKRDNLSALFDKNQLIYVTFLPGSKLSDTIAACEKLTKLGFRARPHIAARSLHSKKALENGLKDIQALGIDSVLLIAGAVRQHKGPYASTLDVLEHHNLADYGIKTVSFAGHPDGNPDITAQEIAYAEKLKQHYMIEHQLRGTFTTQFCFKASPVIHWIERLQQSGNTMPANIGVPGVLSTKSLINHARACGVGASMNYMFRYSRSLKQLLGINTPDAFIYDLAVYNKQQRNGSLLNRIHFFPFGGLDATLAWIDHIRRGQFDINKKGFHIHDS